MTVYLYLTSGNFYTSYQPKKKGTNKNILIIRTMLERDENRNFKETSRTKYDMDEFLQATKQEVNVDRLEGLDLFADRLICCTR